MNLLSSKLLSGAALTRLTSTISLSSSALAAPRPLLSLCQTKQQQTRRSSHSPLGTPSPPSRKKVTLGTLRAMHKRGEPITMITAHDFPSAHVADAAGMDMILVGDSLAMVALGMEDTSEVLVDEMLLHCRSVARATKSAFTVRNIFVFFFVFCHGHTMVPSHLKDTIPSHVTRLFFPQSPIHSAVNAEPFPQPGRRPPHGLLRGLPLASP